MPDHHPASSSSLTLARRAALAVLAGLPLVCWPGLDQPFSTPKLWTLVLAIVLLGPQVWIARMRRDARTSPAPGDRATDTPSFLSEHWLPLLWIAAWSWSSLLGDVVSLDTVLLAFSTALFAIVLNELAIDPTHIVRALITGATGVAIIALLQWVGDDPFALAGWIPPIDGASPRLRIYATLGNPNFVASFLAATMPLTVSEMLGRDKKLAFRLLFVDALLLQVGALAATGSRAGALGVIVATITWLVLTIRHHASSPGGAPAARGALGALGARGARDTKLTLTLSLTLTGAVLALLTAAALIVFSPARRLDTTVAGRLYIWRAAWPHAFDKPLAGQGPGGFELRYPAWEREARAVARANAGGRGFVEFAGPQQHAHNDYLEALVDRGLSGPVTILIVLATCLRRSWRRPDAVPAPVTSTLVGAAAALAALGAIACVDFPLARPTDTMLWWSASALLDPARRRT